MLIPPSLGFVAPIPPPEDVKPLAEVMAAPVAAVKAAVANVTLPGVPIESKGAPAAIVSGVAGVTFGSLLLAVPALVAALL